MRVIAFDGYWLCGGPPSGVNVLTSLIYSWTSMYPQDKIIIFVPSEIKIHFPLEEHRNIEFILRPSRSKNHGLWVSFEMLPNKFQADAILTQNFTPIFRRGSSHTQFTFCHDLIFKEHPEWFTLRERVYLKMVTSTLQKADYLLTSTHSEKNRIAKFFPEILKRIIVSGLDIPISLQILNQERYEKIAEKQKSFILAVGRLNVRKNISKLVAAYLLSRLRDTHDLYIVGETNGKFQALDVLSENVHFLQGVSYSELSWLYSHASLFVFPSLDEGFGLPLVEAYFFDCPAIASDIAPFREINTAMYYFDPNSPIDIKNKMELAIFSPKLEVREIRTYDGSWTIPIQRIRDAI